ncbi:MAG: hypothetical protein ACXV5S_01270 [Acidimicrobiales bacterium]
MERSVAMNWYAYKVLADTYDADRRAEAAGHRRARESAHHRRDRGASDSARAGSSTAARRRWSSELRASLPR